MEENKIYKLLINNLLKVFRSNLRAMVLFGSRARGDARENSDHDIFLIVDNLPDEKLARLKKVRMAVWDVPMRINAIVKTKKEIDINLTPLLLDICVDGICLYGKEFFELYRKKALDALTQAGLKRKFVGQEWYWLFEKNPRKEWELTWEGFCELK